MEFKYRGKTYSTTLHYRPDGFYDKSTINGVDLEGGMPRKYIDGEHALIRVRQRAKRNTFSKHADLINWYKERL